VIPLSSSFVNVAAWDRGYFSAEGTWTIEREGHAFPINVSKISCFRQEKLCYEAQARITGNYLASDLEIHPVVKWDDTTLEFTNEAACVTYVYVANRRTAKVTGRREIKTKAGEECKLGFELKRDLALSLVDGPTVGRELQAKASPNAISLAGASVWSLIILLWLVRLFRA
jgi:hypothetical protein